MLYGAAYYHEYQPYERLQEDIRLMQEAGLTVVRLGEFDVEQLGAGRRTISNLRGWIA